MRVIVTSSVLVACLGGSSPIAEARVTTASAQPAIHACSLLTRELAAQYDTRNPKLRAISKPSEEAIGAHGSSCTDGGVMLQVDPFARADALRTSPGKDWQPLTGIGDAAFFRDNGGRWAEVMVWTGAHHFTLQIDVPAGSTAESVKPKVTGLATALIAKLKV